MYPATLMMCKLLWFLLFASYYHTKFQGLPHLPLLPILDILRPVEGLYNSTLKTAYWLGGFALLFNLRVRLAAFMLGVIVLLIILSDRTHYRNHTFICGCAFILAACHKKDERPWLLIIQLTVVYIAAGLNKLWEVDWRSGQFMAHWLRGNSWFNWFAEYFGKLGFGQFLAYLTITFEVGMGLLFLSKRWLPVAVWCAVGFHIGLYVLLGGQTFGHFLQSALVVMIATVSWNSEPLTLRLPKPPNKLLLLFKRVLDPNSQFEISVHNSFGFTQNELGKFDGIGALRSATLRSPWFYWWGLLSMIVLHRYIQHPPGYYITSFLMISLFALSFPYETLQKNIRGTQVS
ncbi:MAG: DoxX family membrane protein [Verrucomicrobiota bacterium]